MSEPAGRGPDKRALASTAAARAVREWRDSLLEATHKRDRMLTALAEQERETGMEVTIKNLTAEESNHYSLGVSVPFWDRQPWERETVA